MSAFNRRPEYRLTSQKVTLEATDAVKALGPVEEVTATVVAVSVAEPAAR